MPSMEGKHFLFVESNTTGTGALAVTRLLESGARVTFLARQPGKYPFLTAPAPGLSVVVLDTNDVDAVAASVAGIRKQRGLDAILTFSEFYVATVAEVAQRYGYRYLSPAAARACRNKFETRKALRAAGLAVPEFRLAASEEEACRAAREVAYPCVVKPPADSSSKGVRLVRDGEELLDHFRQLHAWGSNDRGQRLSGEVLIESLLTGPEVSVETVTLSPGDVRVIGITAKHLSPPPLFVEVGHDFPAAPAALGEEEAAAIHGMVLAALAAVGFDFGPAHTEIRLTPAGPVVVEINPRLAGGMIPELVRHALGIDLLTAFLNQLDGQPVDLAPLRAEWASIRFLIAGRSGCLAGVSGVDEARRVPSVREVSIGKRPGAAVRPAEEAADRIGFVIASGPARAQVLLDVEEAARRVRLEINP
ncbi:MAG TPA: ATP-grasp domain-containing protein [Thermoanaerobaculia bacterium]|nr:ATP-grasp domain-containing protein [Thermoanaerobaculia bacterium]